MSDAQYNAELTVHNDKIKAVHSRYPPMSNNELLKVHSGIENVYFLFDSWHEKNGVYLRVIDIKFSIPVIKRPLNPRDQDLVLAYAAVHPRHWWVYIAIFYEDDFKNEYVDTVSFPILCDNGNTLKWREAEQVIDAKIAEMKEEGNAKHFRRVIWCATVGNKVGLAQREICKRAYKSYSQQNPQINFEQD